ncbi:unnamed protein product [Closterium sp. Naga37s-1]|nr:unnamed protein product [Closterium sp. Naga37s-1]
MDGVQLLHGVVDPQAAISAIGATPHPPSPPPFLALLIPAPLAPHPSPSLYHAHSTSLSPISRLPPPISLPTISLPPISLSPQSPPTSHRCISIGRGTRELHQPPPAFLPSPHSPHLHPPDLPPPTAAFPSGRVSLAACFQPFPLFNPSPS